MTNKIQNKFIPEWQFLLESSKLLEEDDINNLFRELTDKYGYTDIEFKIRKYRDGIGVIPYGDKSIEFVEQLYNKLENNYKYNEEFDEEFDDETLENNPCETCQLTDDECVPEECDKIIDFLKQRQSTIIINKIENLIKENEELKNENEDLKKLFDNLLKEK